MMTTLPSAYQRIQERNANDQCVILDGSTSTELERMRSRDFQVSDTSLWGTWGLYHAPYDVLGECVVAFSLNGDVESQERQRTLELLTRVFEDEPPDLILMEPLSLIRGDITFSAVELMLETGIPVWLSFRRCRHDVMVMYLIEVKRKGI